MKFQPARHAGEPNSNTAGVKVMPSPREEPNAPCATSFAVNTSGDGHGGVEEASGLDQAFPIVANDIGSQNTCTPTP